MAVKRKLRLSSDTGIWIIISLFGPCGNLGNIQKVNLAEKFALFAEHWKPKIAGELNGQHVKLVKLQGEFVWHKHEAQDELFLVVRGEMRLDYREGGERSLILGEGEFAIVPRGVEHRPVAREEAHVLLFEPAGTLNTGNVRSPLTAGELDHI